jgi:hypothetical protein
LSRATFAYLRHTERFRSGAFTEKAIPLRVIW